MPGGAGRGGGSPPGEAAGRRERGSPGEKGRGEEKAPNGARNEVPALSEGVGPASRELAEGSV